MEAVRTSETSVDNHFTRQYIPEDNSELHTRRREDLKSHIVRCKLHIYIYIYTYIYASEQVLTGNLIGWLVCWLLKFWC
jgi:hypothetical protein